MKIIKFPETKNFISQDDSLCVEIPETDMVLKIPQASVLATLSKMIDIITSKSQISQSVLDEIKQKIKRKHLTESNPCDTIPTMNEIPSESALLELTNMYVNGNHPCTVFHIYELQTAAKMTLAQAHKALQQHGFAPNIINEETLFVKKSCNDNNDNVESKKDSLGQETHEYRSMAEIINIENISPIETNEETKLICENNKIINEIKERLKTKQYKDEKDKQRLIKRMKEATYVCEKLANYAKVYHPQLLDRIRDAGIEEAISFQIHCHQEFTEILQELHDRNINIPKNTRSLDKFKSVIKDLQKQSKFDDAEFLISIEYLAPFITSRMSKIHEKKMNQFSNSNSWISNKEDPSFEIMVGSEESANLIRNEILNISNDTLRKAVEMFKRVQCKRGYNPQPVSSGEINS